MQEDRGKGDGNSKVAAFLGGGLDAVTENEPEKRASTTNATGRRPRIELNIRDTNSSQPKLNDSIGSHGNNSQYMSDGGSQIRNSNAVSIYLNANNEQSKRPSTQGNVGISKAKLAASSKVVIKNERPKPVKKPQRDISKNHVKVCEVTTENAFDIIDEFYELKGKSFIENRLLLVETDF